jgi:hypothetical protein
MAKEKTKNPVNPNSRTLIIPPDLQKAGDEIALILIGNRNLSAAVRLLLIEKAKELNIKI